MTKGSGREGPVCLQIDGDAALQMNGDGWEKCWTLWRQAAHFRAFSPGRVGRGVLKMPYEMAIEYGWSVFTKKSSGGHMKLISVASILGLCLIFPFTAAAMCPYDKDCLDNPYGAGSPYKKDGLLNPNSKYASPYSDKTWTNPYAKDAPKLYDSKGNYRGKLSSNPYDPDSISNPYGKYGSPYSPDSLNNPFGAGNPYSDEDIYVVPSQ
jgi:hypothetical protein